MSHRRMNKRAVFTATAAAAGLLAAAVLLPSASASPDEAAPVALFSGEQAQATGTALTGRLGDQAAGWYYDAGARQLVVNVLGEEAADRVRAEGAVARQVDNSIAELRAATGTLRAQASVPGTAWSLDPRTNTVRVVADRTVSTEGWTQLTGVTDRMGQTVTVKRYAGEFKPFAQGGDPIFGDGSRCSLGFHVQVQGAKGFLTAGHCGPVGTTWSAQQGGQPLGSTAVSEFPGSDFALVGYDDPDADAPASVNLGNGSSRPITEAVEASVGLQVQRSGSTTGVSDGVVTGLNATVNYGNGDIVNGLIETDVCAEPGDSGGALFSGTAAVGLTSGGSGDCTQGGITFFQPVTTALQAVGAELLTDQG